MQIRELIQNGFLWIAVPILAIVIVAAGFAGKIAKMGVALLVLAVAAGVMFMPDGTLRSIGGAVAGAISSFLSSVGA